MKLLLTLTVTVVATALLSGCSDELIAEPVSVRQTQGTSTPAPTVDPASPAEVVQSVEIPVEVPVEQVVQAPSKRSAPTVQPPAAPEVPAAVAPAPIAAPVVPLAAVPAMEPEAIVPRDSFNPFAALDAWLLAPTFECEEGFAPGWLNDAGIPTGCVAN
ncbi:hypothetical protein [Cryobacterium sp. PH31-O1]|uniref:hypothetical protein n=1 Tax=Cryobacterium sp. PH31-O1 TaxID=3046306 RepID=UPI0024BAB9BF|nr:hypothetical protein [Cryobacterium sp. PH31-O1]MDJ0337479.1 hypothetical protein [Cryobacterium sp. PH31-O1]